MYFLFWLYIEAYVRILVLLYVELTIKRLRDALFVLTEPDSTGSHRHEQENVFLKFELRAIIL